MSIDIKSLLALTKDLTLLYVEDDDQLRQNTAELFLNFFKSVTTANNGEAGLQHYKEASFDLIITDILMPQMNGLDMSSAIRQIDPTQHIIIISAYNDPHYFETSINIGVDGYIVKPINNTQLLQTLFRTASKISDHNKAIRYHQTLEEEIQKRTREINRNMVVDRITGLANRTALDQVLDPEAQYNVILFNIDNFSSVNLTFGYTIGDEVLKNIGSFLRQKLGDSEKLYRIGSDEFVYITQGYDINYLQELAASIQKDLINRTITLPMDASVRLTLTAAIAHAKGEHVIKNAELALYEARRIGKNQLYTYKEDLPIFSIQKERLDWINKIRIALDNNLITPFFQPIVDTKTKEIVKYESLARIVDKGAIITPNYFIEPARVSGQITALTKMMIKKSFAQFEHNKYDFSINIESEDLNANYLPDYIAHYAKKYGIKHDRIVVEILENIHTYNEKETIDQLLALKEMGIKIAIDDFGNEQSNFSRLLDIQADFIKIDGQFIKSIDYDSKSYKISAAITSLAESLDAKIIAEFVHKQEVYDKILELNIDYSQGYFFGMPSAKIK